MLSRILKEEKGGAIAETAIVLPLTLGIIFSVFVVTWAATAKTVIMSAARDAARVYVAYTWDDPRYGLQGRHRATMEATRRAEDALNLAGFRADRLTVTIRPGVPDSDHVTVDLRYDLPLPLRVAPGSARGVKAAWLLTGHAMAKMERQELFR